MKNMTLHSTAICGYLVTDLAFSSPQIAEQTPLNGLRIGQLALEAGIPPGVLNVIPGITASFTWQGINLTIQRPTRT